MTKDQSLEARVARLEETITGSDPVMRRYGRWLIPALGAVLVMAAVMPNIWTWRALNQLRDQRSKEHLFWMLCQPGFTDEQRRQAFSELLWLGNREWRSARITRLDLTGAQLAGAEVEWAHLEGCNFAKADLARAVLSHSQLDSVDFSQTDLSHAKLFEVDLLKANLAGANLSGADLRGSDLGQSQAAGANFALADLTGARLDLADLTQADLRLAKLVDADLHVANLRSTNLFRTDLTGADLTGTNLGNSNWWQARGLTPGMIDQLTKQFPPSEDAEPALKKDFEQWLAQRPPRGSNEDSSSHDP